MKVLITGANGFLGSWLVDRLVAQGDDVTVLLRNIDRSDNYKKRNINVVQGDITDLESLKTATHGQDQVYHLAGLVAYNRREREIMQKINVDGTANILEASVFAKVKRILLVSSVVSVGATFTPEVLNEESSFELTKYHLGYHETKRQAEALLRRYVADGKVDGVIVNPSTIYGAGDASKSSRSTQLKVARGEMFSYPSGGVSIVAVEDVIEGMLSAMQKGRSGERYILSGENLTLKEVFDRIADIAGVARPWLPVPALVLKGLAKIDDLMACVGKSGPLPSERALVALMYHWYDASKARQELGFTTRPAQQALENSVNWMSQQGLLRN
ncbi:MAG: hypothetical protein RJB66_1525 [Pseudomonadota bacterium]|jgi:dihydroflavonol-4-reductase